MTANPFQTPSSAVAGSDGHDNDMDDDHLYCVSKRKFLVLYIVTLGGYAIYWSYKNWALAKKNEGIPVWPVLRGLFLVFFMHGLMRKASEMGARKNIDYPFPHQAYATVAVILIVMERVFDRLANKNIGYPMVDIISLSIVFVMAYVFWRMQNFINIISGDALGRSNEKFTGANVLWIVLGSIVWAAVIIGYIVLISGIGRPE